MTSPQEKELEKQGVCITEIVDALLQYFSYSFETTQSFLNLFSQQIVLSLHTTLLSTVYLYNLSVRKKFIAEKKRDFYVSALPSCIFLIKREPRSELR
jgi:hypothetical protein